MKSPLLILWLLIVNHILNAQIFLSDCKKFHMGSFYYVDSLSQRILVERKKKVQVEKNLSTSYIYKFKIRWTDDCTYQLTNLIWTNDKNYLKRSKTKKGDTTPIKIIATDDNSYVYDCSCPGSKDSIGKMYINN